MSSATSNSTDGGPPLAVPGQGLGRAPRRPDLTPSEAKANVARSKVRSAVETVFAAQKHRFGLFVRTIGLARATVKIGLANLTYNMRRLVWIEQCKAPA